MKQDKTDLKFHLLMEYNKENFNQLVYFISALGCIFVFFLLPLYSSPSITGVIFAEDISSQFDIISPFELGFLLFTISMAFIALSIHKKKKIEDAIASL